MIIHGLQLFLKDQLKTYRIYQRQHNRHTDERNRSYRNFVIMILVEE